MEVSDEWGLATRTQLLCSFENILEMRVSPFRKTPFQVFYDGDYFSVCHSRRTEMGEEGTGGGSIVSCVKS